MANQEVAASIKRSKEVVGHLYPVLVKKGSIEVIDGFHRKKADLAWPEKEVEVKDEKSALLIRIHANYRRQISRGETKTGILRLARILEEEEKVPREKIAATLASILPYDENYIRTLLPQKYKQIIKAPKTKPPGRPRGKTEVIPEKAKKPIASFYMCPVCGSKLRLEGDKLIWIP